MEVYKQRKELIYKGPSKFMSIGNKWNYINPHIIEVTMRHNGKTINVESNKLTIVAQQNTIFVYHSYNYKIHGKLVSGRWYNTKFPLNVFKNLNNNQIRFHIENYEFDDGETAPVDFIIVFSEKAATVLRNFIL